MRYSHILSPLWMALIIVTGLSPAFAAVITVDDDGPADFSGQPKPVIIDHNCIDVSKIPEQYLKPAAALRVLFRHASVGQGIDWGLNCLAGKIPTNSDCSGYPVGKFDRTNWVFGLRAGDWKAKMDDLVEQTASRTGEFDVFMMKFCYIDALGDTSPDWEYCRTRMEQLERDYPDKTFVWWTIPLTRDGMPGTDRFNALVRAYCKENNKVLFDIADIECYDLDGTKLTNTNGNEVISQNYTKEIHAGHLNTTGRIRVASAFWYMMAALAAPQPSPGLIQPAIDSAKDGDVIVIRPGRYTGPGNRDIDFKGKTLTVRSTDPNDPNIVAATVIDCNGSEEQPHRGFYLNGCSEAKICGLTITGGFADAGGGIYCGNCKVTISNCTIKANATIKGATGSSCVPGGDGGKGGGILLVSSAATISGCEIIANGTGAGGQGGGPCSQGFYGKRGGNGGDGAGICCVDSSQLEIWQSNIADNTTGDGGNPGVGNRDGDSGSGGGIFCDKSSFLVIRKCLISNNRTGTVDPRLPVHGYCRGGGISCFYADVNDCSFVGNKVGTQQRGYGGGMFVDEGNTNVRNCTFYGNLTGGSLYLSKGSTVVSNCTFSKNDSDVITNSSGKLTLADSTFTNNVDNANSSGVMCSNSGTFIMDRCSIEDNGGTGVFVQYGDNTINRCTIKGNVVGIAARFGNYTISQCIVERNGSENGGGGIDCYTDDRFTMSRCIVRSNANRHWAGGIIVMGYQGKFTIQDCLIAGNATYGAGYGGGILCRKNANPIINNCTITDNWSNGKGGGIYTEADSSPTGEPTVLNSIVWGNIAPIGRQIAVTTGDPSAGYQPSSIGVSYSAVEGGFSAVYVEPDSKLNWGAGNISADPCFVQPGYWADANVPNVIVEPNVPNAVWVEGDYHLKSQAGRWNATSQSWANDDATSLCIDAGDPMSPIGLEPFPNGGRINMGAYGGKVEASKSYFGEPVCETSIAGDINGDCKVNLADFQIMTFHWLEDGSP